MIDQIIVNLFHRHRRIAPARPIRFRRLADGSLASDAVVAVRYGRGRLVYPRAIVLAAPAAGLTEIDISERDFPLFREAAPTLLGWAARPDLRFAGSSAIDADQTNWEQDWVTNPLLAAAGITPLAQTSAAVESAAEKNTLLRYLYRDGANYKGYVELILPGALSIGGASLIRATCEDEERFLPTQVGLPPAQERLWDAHQRSGDDHVWNELLELRSTEQSATPGAPSVATLLRAFETAAARGWDIPAAVEALRL